MDLWVRCGVLGVSADGLKESFGVCCSGSSCVVMPLVMVIGVGVRGNALENPMTEPLERM